MSQISGISRQSVVHDINRPSKERNNFSTVTIGTIGGNDLSVETNNPSRILDDFFRGSSAKSIGRPAANDILKDKRKTKQESVTRIVAFGSTLIERGSYESGAQWLQRQRSKTLSKTEQEKFTHLARPLTYKVHDECIPQYTFKPDMINPHRRRSKKEMEDWCYKHSRPRTAPIKPDMKKPPRRTKPRTKSERKAWEYEQSRPRPAPQPPGEDSKKKKKKSHRTKDELVLRLEELSRPKRIYQKSISPPYVNKNALNYIMTARMEELADPGQLTRRMMAYENPELTMEEIANKLKKAHAYKITPRVNKLAEPRVYPTKADDLNLEAFSVKPAALTCKPSKRIIELAVPRVPYVKDEYDPYYVKPVGENYVIKPRLEELSKPIARPNPPTNPFAFTVSPAALKYKASPRMIELSRPKPDPMYAKHNCFRVVAPPPPPDRQLAGDPKIPK